MTHSSTGVLTMSKERNNTRETKKKPAKTMSEKKAEKRAKKETEAVRDALIRQACSSRFAWAGVLMARNAAIASEPASRPSTRPNFSGCTQMSVHRFQRPAIS